jgi:hypothetical protein
MATKTHKQRVGYPPPPVDIIRTGAAGANKLAAAGGSCSVTAMRSLVKLRIESIRTHSHYHREILS